MGTLSPDDKAISQYLHDNDTKDLELLKNIRGDTNFFINKINIVNGLLIKNESLAAFINKIITGKTEEQKIDERVGVYYITPDKYDAIHKEYKSTGGDDLSQIRLGGRASDNTITKIRYKKINDLFKYRPNSTWEVNLDNDENVKNQAYTKTRFSFTAEQIGTINNYNNKITELQATFTTANDERLEAYKELVADLTNTTKKETYQKNHTQARKLYDLLLHLISKYNEFIAKITSMKINNTEITNQSVVATPSPFIDKSIIIPQNN
jgi:hypothetical protein